MVRPRTVTNKSYTDHVQTEALKAVFDPWIGEYPNVREITFKPNMDNFTVFVLYDEVVGDDYDGY